MSCFCFPKYLLKELEQAMRNFWWHSRGDSRVHWVAWSKLCRPLKEGGLGFRDLKAFNLALLAKQGWRLITQPESLLSRVLKARYFPQGTFWDASIGSRPSLTWLSRVLKARYFPQGTFWDASIGSRPSLTWRSILLARGVLMVGCEQQSDSNGHRGRPVLWKSCKKGVFSVKSAYEISLDLGARGLASSSRPFPLLAEGCENFWSKMWGLVMPPRVRVQAWRFCYEAVPTMENLSKKRAGVEKQCVICGAEIETLQHILLECPFARVVWAISNIPWWHIRSWTEGAAEWLSSALQNLDRTEGARFLTLC
ncbi:UNVERIFIED_CONTAM: putative mitochondrial protein [Sesamum radiatum]|uniref:Mitochondrial protein n=1 Tax=Sesamum radiatum TaxID=300843 RepID=A0AAW2PMR0_SESRA